MQVSDKFDREGYAVLPSIISEDIRGLAERYALMQEIVEPDFREISKEDSFKVHTKYADFLMESLLINLKVKFEAALGKLLVPTYSMYRIYRPGASLAPHTDRQSCEISVTLTLAVDSINSWPIYMQDVPVELEAGDAVIYKGIELPHSRPVLTGKDSGYCIQVFLHYCLADGDYAEMHKFDKRPSLGFPSSSRKARQVRGN